MKWREILCPWSEIRRQRGWLQLQRRLLEEALSECGRLRHLLAQSQPKQARDSKGRFISRTRPTQ